MLLIFLELLYSIIIITAAGYCEHFSVKISCTAVVSDTALRSILLTIHAAAAGPVYVQYLEYYSTYSSYIIGFL